MENTTTASEEEEDSPIDPRILFPAMVIVVFMTLLAILGNILVIIAYLKDTKLQNVLNFYIFNLAVTDFLLGAISMPFYAVYTALNWKWPFGRAFCKVYLVCDFTLCLQSVLLVIVISVDRLILVRSGMEYTVKQTMKSAKVKVAVCWIAAFLLYGPAVIGFDYWRGSTVISDRDCDVEFYNHLTFTLTTSIIEFGAPFLSIAVINGLVFVEIRKRVKIREGLTGPKGNSSDVTSDVPAVNQTDDKSAQIAIIGTESFGSKDNGGVSVATARTKVGNKSDRKSSEKKNIRSPEVKAARALFILVLTLAICWTPYTVCTIFVSICQFECINEDLYELLNWPLWFKASINPFLYAFQNEKFRENFIKLVPFLRYPLKIYN